MRRFSVLVAGVAASVVFLTPSAQAANYVSLPAVQRTVTADRSVERADCAVTPLAGRPGVGASSFTVGQPLSVAVLLDGPAGSDWDLAVFDRATGREVGGSAGFGASEVVTGLAGTGDVLDIQACRVSGSGSTAKLTIRSVALTGPSPALTRLGEQNRLEMRAAPRAAAAAAGPTVPTGRTEYRHLADFQAELKKLAQENPAIVRPVTLPKKTFQGRDTMGVEISSDVNRADDQKPTSFVMGTHHAREWPSGEIAMEFAHYLTKGFGTEKDVTSILNRVRVVVVPIINSDGYNASREAPDFADQSGDPAGAPSLAESVAVGGSLAYRRKNCNSPLTSDPAVPCDFQTGVDPNRNYGFNWGGPGASTSPNSQSYRGTGPWSEPETQAVHEFSQVHNITSLVTIHNFASLVLRPPGLQVDGKAPDEERLKALGDAMASDTGYTSEFGYELYDTSGTTEDWNYGAAGTFGYTIELGPASDDDGNFHVSYEKGVIDQWNGSGVRAGRGMRKALLRLTAAATNRKDFATFTGHAPAGRILRLHKTFKTATSPVCQIAGPSDVSNDAVPDDCVNPGDPILVDDKLDYVTKVPATGSFGWVTGPSTRPFVAKKGGSEAWTLTCEDTAGKVFETMTVTIGRGETKNFELPCGSDAPLSTSSTSVLDKTAPDSHFTVAAVKASRTKISLAGTATDTAPSGLTPRVARVLVSIGRHIGTSSKCHFLTPDGRFTKAVQCGGVTPYVVAQVKASAAKVGWTYSLGAKLPKGRYFAWSRGVDASGNRERKQRTRNHIDFRIG